jgi:ribose transport system permease protein
MSISAAIASGVRVRALRRWLGNGAAVAAALYLVLFAIYASQQPDALTVSGATDLFNNALPLALAAAGATLVVVTRGFDLSVAGVVSLANVLMVTAIGQGPWAPIFGLVVVIALGLAVGLVNGWLVAYVGLQSVTATLATMIMCSGAALLILNFPGGDVPAFMTDELTGTRGEFVPVAALIAVATLLAWTWTRRTDWGVGLYAVGADETAATLAGLSTKRIRLCAYAVAGVLYGLAGYMLTALTSTGDPNAGNTFLILTYAAIAVGGTSFNGGHGGVYGSMIGAATLTLLQKVLFAVGILSFYAGIMQGLVMILAVLIGAQSARIAHWARR